MNPDLRDIHGHMLDLGLGALAHANWHANYFYQDSGHWPGMSVLQAALAAETLIKARIAEEHPLLVFAELPGRGTGGQAPEARELLERGRAFEYAALPDRLWSTAGVALENADAYRSFGRLRNAVQYRAPPEHVNLSRRAVEFIYDVIDPFIHECWGLYAADYNEEYEPYVAFVAALIRRGVRFLVSPRMLENIDDIDFNWPAYDEEYREEMLRRIYAARKAAAAA